MIPNHEAVPATPNSCPTVDYDCHELPLPRSVRLELGGPGGSQTAVLHRGEALVLGSGEQADVRVADPTVSRLHARLSLRDASATLEDLGSKNGTIVGGASIQKALLGGVGSSFRMGRTSVSLQAIGGEVSSVACDLVPELIGRASCMRRLAAEIRRVARLDVPVLLQGESGTGKDVVARAIHRISRRPGRYVALNAGALGDALADSELFGHRRGAFTGAVQAHSGAFEHADQGTLFLDEVAELSPSVQVKLLRAVETGEVRQVGGLGVTRVRARIIAASWAPLHHLVEEERFRADLYHRLSVFVIHLPPLRHRKGDIPLLARHLFREKREQLGDRRLSPGAVARLEAYNFPGNVRELFAVLFRAAVAVDGQLIEASDIEAALPLPTSHRLERAARLDALRLLEAHDGNVSAAARSARVARSTFRCWLKRQRERGHEA